jgi:hypothetical protein
MQPARLTTALIAILLLGAAPAAASTVRLDPGGGDRGSTVTYTAAPGEANKVSVSVDGPKATIDDPGASAITVQQGCTQVTPTRATCDLQSSTDDIQEIVADLGDGADTFAVTAGTTFVGSVVKGGPGNDVLNGGPYSDNLDGGGGIDTLHGGDGQDFLTDGDVTGAADGDVIDGGAGESDFLSYSERTAPVSVDLALGTPAAGEAGEGDTVTGVEGVDGGKSDDTLRGNEASNGLSGAEGNDTLDGRGGNDQLFGGSGNDTLIGGAGVDDDEAEDGNDVIRLDNPPGVHDRYILCGNGTDSVEGLTAAPSVGLDCETTDLGSGIVRSTLPRRVTTGYVSISIPCPAAFRDASGLCAGKLVVEPKGAYAKSASTRFKQRYGAKELRFRTASARITVPLNAEGRKQLRKPFFKLQFTLRLNETATGKVKQIEWTQYLSRAELKKRGVG